MTDIQNTPPTTSPSSQANKPKLGFGSVQPIQRNPRLTNTGSSVSPATPQAPVATPRLSPTFKSNYAPAPAGQKSLKKYKSPENDRNIVGTILNGLGVAADFITKPIGAATALAGFGIKTTAVNTAEALDVIGATIPGLVGLTKQAIADVGSLAKYKGAGVVGNPRYGTFSKAADPVLLNTLKDAAGNPVMGPDGKPVLMDRWNSAAEDFPFVSSFIAMPSTVLAPSYLGGIVRDFRDGKPIVAKALPIALLAAGASGAIGKGLAKGVASKTATAEAGVEYTAAKAAEKTAGAAAAEAKITFEAAAKRATEVNIQAENLAAQVSAEAAAKTAMGIPLEEAMAAAEQAVRARAGLAWADMQAAMGETVKANEYKAIYEAAEKARLEYSAKMSEAVGMAQVQNWQQAYNVVQTIRKYSNQVSMFPLVPYVQGLGLIGKGYRSGWYLPNGTLRGVSVPNAFNAWGEKGVRGLANEANVLAEKIDAGDFNPSVTGTVNGYDTIGPPKDLRFGNGSPGSLSSPIKLAEAELKRLRDKASRLMAFRMGREANLVINRNIRKTETAAARRTTQWNELISRIDDSGVGLTSAEQGAMSIVYNGYYVNIVAMQRATGLPIPEIIKMTRYNANDGSYVDEVMFDLANDYYTNNITEEKYGADWEALRTRLDKTHAVLKETMRPITQDALLGVGRRLPLDIRQTDVIPFHDKIIKDLEAIVQGRAVSLTPSTPDDVARAEFLLKVIEAKIEKSREDDIQIFLTENPGLTIDDITPDIPLGVFQRRIDDPDRRAFIQAIWEMSPESLKYNQDNFPAPMRPLIVQAQRMKTNLERQVEEAGNTDPIGPRTPPGAPPKPESLQKVEEGLDKIIRQHRLNPRKATEDTIKFFNSLSERERYHARLLYKMMKSLDQMHSIYIKNEYQLRNQEIIDAWLNNESVENLLAQNPELTEEGLKQIVSTNPVVMATWEVQKAQESLARGVATPKQLQVSQEKLVEITAAELERINLLKQDQQMLFDAIEEYQNYEEIRIGTMLETEGVDVDILRQLATVDGVNELAGNIPPELSAVPEPVVTAPEPTQVVRDLVQEENNLDKEIELAIKETRRIQKIIDNRQTSAIDRSVAKGTLEKLEADLQLLWKQLEDLPGSNFKMAKPIVKGSIKDYPQAAELLRKMDTLRQGDRNLSVALRNKIKRLVDAALVVGPTPLTDKALVKIIETELTSKQKTLLKKIPSAVPKKLNKVSTAADANAWKPDPRYAELDKEIAILEQAYNDALAAAPPPAPKTPKGKAAPAAATSALTPAPAAPAGELSLDNKPITDDLLRRIGELTGYNPEAKKTLKKITDFMNEFFAPIVPMVPGKVKKLLQEYARDALRGRKLFLVKDPIVKSIPGSGIEWFSDSYRIIPKRMFPELGKLENDKVYSDLDAKLTIGNPKATGDPPPALLGIIKEILKSPNVFLEFQYTTTESVRGIGVVLLNPKNNEYFIIDKKAFLLGLTLAESENVGSFQINSKGTIVFIKDKNGSLVFATTAIKPKGINVEIPLTDQDLADAIESMLDYKTKSSLTPSRVSAQPGYEEVAAAMNAKPAAKTAAKPTPPRISDEDWVIAERARLHKKLGKLLGSIKATAKKIDRGGIGPAYDAIEEKFELLYKEHDALQKELKNINPANRPKETVIAQEEPLPLAALAAPQLPAQLAPVYDAEAAKRVLIANAKAALDAKRQELKDLENADKIPTPAKLAPVDPVTELIENETAQAFELENLKYDIKEAEKAIADEKKKGPVTLFSKMRLEGLLEKQKELINSNKAADDARRIKAVEEVSKSLVVRSVKNFTKPDARDSRDITNMFKTPASKKKAIDALKLLAESFPNPAQPEQPYPVVGVYGNSEVLRESLRQLIHFTISALEVKGTENRIAYILDKIQGINPELKKQLLSGAYRSPESIASIPLYDSHHPLTKFASSVSQKIDLALDALDNLRLASERYADINYVDYSTVSGIERVSMSSYNKLHPAEYVPSYRISADELNFPGVTKPEIYISAALPVEMAIDAISGFIKGLEANAPMRSSYYDENPSDIQSYEPRLKGFHTVMRPSALFLSKKNKALKAEVIAVFERIKSSLEALAPQNDIIDKLRIHQFGTITAPDNVARLLQIKDALASRPIVDPTLTAAQLRKIVPNREELLAQRAIRNLDYVTELAMEIAAEELAAVRAAKTTKQLSTAQDALLKKMQRVVNADENLKKVVRQNLEDPRSLVLEKRRSRLASRIEKAEAGIEKRQTYRVSLSAARVALEASLGINFETTPTTPEQFIQMVREFTSGERLPASPEMEADAELMQHPVIVELGMQAEAAKVKVRNLGYSAIARPGSAADILSKNDFAQIAYNAAVKLGDTKNSIDVEVFTQDGKEYVQVGPSYLPVGNIESPVNTATMRVDHEGFVGWIESRSAHHRTGERESILDFNTMGLLDVQQTRILTQSEQYRAWIMGVGKTATEYLGEELISALWKKAEDYAGNLPEVELYKLYPEGVPTEITPGIDQYNPSLKNPQTPYNYAVQSRFGELIAKEMQKSLKVPVLIYSSIDAAIYARDINAETYFIDAAAKEIYAQSKTKVTNLTASLDLLKKATASFKWTTLVLSATWQIGDMTTNAIWPLLDDSITITEMIESLKTVYGAIGKHAKEASTPEEQARRARLAKFLRDSGVQSIGFDLQEQQLLRGTQKSLEEDAEKKNAVLSALKKTSSRIDKTRDWSFALNAATNTVQRYAIFYNFMDIYLREQGISWDDFLRDETYAASPEYIAKAEEFANETNDLLGDVVNLSKNDKRIFMLLFPFWAWIKQSHRIFFRLAKDHPARLQFIMYVGMFAMDEDNKKDMQMWDGTVNIFGKNFNTSWLNPFYDVVGGPVVNLVGAMLGSEQYDATKWIQSVNPIIRIPVAAVSGFDLKTLKPVTRPSGSGYYNPETGIERFKPLLNLKDPSEFIGYSIQQIPILSRIAEAIPLKNIPGTRIALGPVVKYGTGEARINPRTGQRNTKQGGVLGALSRIVSTPLSGTTLQQELDISRSSQARLKTIRELQREYERSQVP